MATYHLNCETCGCAFTAMRAQSQSPPRFCSRKCFGASQGDPLKLYDCVCQKCGKFFSAKRASSAQPPKFCSYGCYWASPRITRGRWLVEIPARGRRLVGRRLENGKFVNMPLARWVWNEHHPADPVGPDEHIHHIDGDPLNDDPNNLQKVTVEEHEEIHRTFKRPTSEVLSRRMKAYHKANPGKQRKGESKICSVCGTEFYRPPSANAETCSYVCMGKLRSMRSST